MSAAQTRTMSAAGRLVQCPASFALPAVHAANAARDAAAGKGNTSHAGAEWATTRDIAAGAPDFSTDDGLDHAAQRIMGVLRSWAPYLAALATPGAVLVEAAFALWPEERRAQLLGQSIGRKYPKLEGAVLCGTADLVLALGDEIIVVDHKTGREAPEASTSWQLRALALAAAQSAEIPPSRVRVAILHAPQDGEYAVLKEWQYTMAELFEHGDTLAKSLNAVAAAVADGPRIFTESEECTYCPSARACPAKASLIHAVTHGEHRALAVWQERTTALALTEEDAGQAWALVREAKKRLEEVESLIKSMVTDGARVQLPSGKVLAASSTTRKSFDADAAQSLLRTLGASEEQLAALYRTSSSTSVREVKAPKAA